MRYWPWSSEPLRPSGVGRLRSLGRGHELELVDTRHRAVQEAEAVLAALDLQCRVRGAVDGEDVADETVVREVLEEGLAPPLRVLGRVLRERELAHAVVHVLVGRDPVVETAVVERQRDVVGHIERAVRVVGAHAGEAQALALVAAVVHALTGHVLLGVVDRVQADHALVDVRTRVVHAVIVEPEEALLLAIVISRGPVQVEVVNEHPRRVAVRVRPMLHRVVRVAVALGSGVPVVQVGEERPVRSAEVLAVKAQRVLVEVVLEPHQHRLAVLRVDHRAGERAVEGIDGARRQGALGAGGVRLARRVERDGGLALDVDGQHRRRREGMRIHDHIELVDDRIHGRGARGSPHLVPLVARASSAGPCPGRVSSSSRRTPTPGWAWPPSAPAAGRRRAPGSAGWSGTPRCRRGCRPAPRRLRRRRRQG